jgi:hypothetical protein
MPSEVITVPALAFTLTQFAVSRVAAQSRAVVTSASVTPVLDISGAADDGKHRESARAIGLSPPPSCAEPRGAVKGRIWPTVRCRWPPPRLYGVVSSGDMVMSANHGSMPGTPSLAARGPVMSDPWSHGELFAL